MIRCEQRQVVALAKLDEQGINRADLDTPSAAGIANVGGCDVILLIGLKKGEHGEALHELVTVFGAGKTLQHFLEHQSGGEDLLGTLERGTECTHLRRALLAISAKSQLPHRRIDQQTHSWRSRSAL
nr:hypothetical protein [Synechococcus sp. 1G10]